MCWICTAPVYEYEGWLFEYGPHGAWPLRKAGVLRQRAGRVFWGVFSRWYALPEEEREKYRIGGGCLKIGGKE